MARTRGEDTTLNAALRDRLQHVYWIGGGSGAGKSTIARRIATKHGLDVYGTDDVMTDHARRSSREDSPFLHRFIAMDMDERWVKRDPSTMVETFPWFRGEAFSLIVEDLLRLPRETRVIVEGFRALPHLVEPLLSGADRAVWLLPTPDFRQTVFERRGVSSSGFLAITTAPQRALRNLLERDRLFTDILREETERRRLPAVTVTATMTEDDLTRRVAEVLGLHSHTR